MTRNPALKRLRWLMCGVILLDHSLTLIGQPSTFWRDPSTAQEFNALGAWIMHHGWIPTIIASLCWIAGAFALVTFLSARLAWFALMVFLLTHFTAGSGWIMWRFRFGVTGLYVYGVVIAAAFVLLSSIGKEPNQALEPTRFARGSS